MTDAHIEKILDAYKSREDMDKFAHLASFEEIVAKINETNATIESQTASLLDMLGQLHGTTKEADEELKKFVEEFKG